MYGRNAGLTVAFFLRVPRNVSSELMRSCWKKGTFGASTYGCHELTTLRAMYWPMRVRVMFVCPAVRLVFLPASNAKPPVALLIRVMMPEFVFWPRFAPRSNSTPTQPASMPETKSDFHAGDTDGESCAHTLAAKLELGTSCMAPVVSSKICAQGSQ